MRCIDPCASQGVTKTPETYAQVQRRSWFQKGNTSAVDNSQEFKQRGVIALNESYDGIVVGAGPNGLAAAIRLAQGGLSVLVVEANETLGGGTRSGELTLPGFIHDLCSAVHPMAAGSPFFRQLGLEKFGLTWLEPQLPLAHPLDAGQAVALDRSVATTARKLGRDQTVYERLMQPLVSDWEILA